MFKQNFSNHYDSFYPECSLSLVNSLRSFINLKLDHERQTPEFVDEFLQRLHYIHQYNCEVAKMTNKYPRSRQFDLLLIKYIELEFEVLYKNLPSRKLEEESALRILRVLQFMLYPISKNSHSGDKNIDSAVKKSALQLLGEVKPTYLAPDKLICNVANQLLEEIGKVERDHAQSLHNLDTHRNPVTSDYGSDEESDRELDNNFSNRDSNDTKENLNSLTNRVSGVPTVEFTDEDSYFVYLEKRPKRKFEDCTTVSSKRILPSCSNISENSSPSILAKSENIQSDYSDKNHVVKSEETCVVIDSDSEENYEKCNQERNVKKEHSGVVTFEILDDDDDDTTNYMVYLQKEVPTKKKPKKEQLVKDEIIICSDSEDEPEVNNEVVTEQKPVNSQTVTSTNYPIVPEVKEDCNNTISSDDGFSSNASSVSSRNCFLEDNLDDNCTTANQSVLNEKNTKVVEQFGSVITTIQPDSTFIAFGEESQMEEPIEPTLLIDLNIIFDQINNLPLQENQVSNTLNDEIGLLGGPVLGGKEVIDDICNNSDCKLNESLLEELLLDDSLTEGRKQFEELEYFNDITDTQEYSLGSLNFDNDENNFLLPDTFDADLNSLQSILKNSELFN